MGDSQPTVVATEAPKVEPPVATVTPEPTNTPVPAVTPAPTATPVTDSTTPPADPNSGLLDEGDFLGEFDSNLKFNTKRQKAKDKFASNRHRALGDAVFTVGKGGGAQTNPVALPPGEELDGWLAFNAKEIFDQCKSLFGFFF